MNAGIVAILALTLFENKMLNPFNTGINTFGYLEHDVARGILKFQSKPWEFRAMSCSRHPDVFI